jgi:hypothetical protein
VACPAVPYFPHYLINGKIFGKKVIEHKMCAVIFSTDFVWNISHSKKNSARHYHNKVRVKQSRYRPGVAQRVPGN